MAALTSVVLRQDIGEGLPIPRRIAPAALLFAALAGELFTTGSGRSPPGW